MRTIGMYKYSAHDLCPECCAHTALSDSFNYRAPVRLRSYVIAGFATLCGEVKPYAREGAELGRPGSVFSCHGALSGALAS